ncbi:hypothetical protein EVAR_74373_1 [Eumeta japonica]|uniref:Uncharacterized protein n=1 Tax=Eumeta variegata TaxID=151549 RepID=A0A4C1SDW5_EUMVA|nr:hypothetical protein EVAR_74373_1 [Eumeta japonica]
MNANEFRLKSTTARRLDGDTGGAAPAPSRKTSSFKFQNAQTKNLVGWDRDRDGHASSVDIEHGRIHSISTRVETRAKATDGTGDARAASAFEIYRGAIFRLPYDTRKEMSYYCRARLIRYNDPCNVAERRRHRHDILKMARTTGRIGAERNGMRVCCVGSFTLASRGRLRTFRESVRPSTLSMKVTSVTDLELICNVV